MRFALALLLAAGCGPTTAVVGDTGPVDTDLDTDTDSDSDTEAPAPLAWTGERALETEWCEALLVETGHEVTDDPEHAEAVATCGTCDEVFYVAVSPPEICGWVDVDTETWRGVQWTDGGATLYVIDDADGWTRQTLAEATEQTAGLYEYTYEVDGGWGDPVVIEGWVEIASPE